MIEGPIAQDESFVHIRSQVEYTVMNGTTNGSDDTQTLAKVTSEKEGVACATDGWVPAIVYYDPYRPGMTFIRDEENFRQNFERVV